MLVFVNELSKIKKFVNIATKYESDIEVKCGRYVIDAKSLMGMCTIDVSNPVEVTIRSNDEKEIETFEKEMEEFKIERRVD